MLVVFTLTKVSQILVAQILQFCHVRQDVWPKTACCEVFDDTLSVPLANSDFIIVPIDRNYGFPEFFTRYAPPLCTATLSKLAYPAINGDKHTLFLLVTISHSDHEVVVMRIVD